MWGAGDVFLRTGLVSHQGEWLRWGYCLTPGGPLLNVSEFLWAVALCSQRSLAALIVVYVLEPTCAGCQRWHAKVPANWCPWTENGGSESISEGTSPPPPWKCRCRQSHLPALGITTLVPWAARRFGDGHFSVVGRPPGWQCQAMGSQSLWRQWEESESICWTNSQVPAWASLQLYRLYRHAPKQALLRELELLRVRALGVTRDTKVSPGDKVCESDICRG